MMILAPGAHLKQLQRERESARERIVFPELQTSFPGITAVYASWHQRSTINIPNRRVPRKSCFMFGGKCSRVILYFLTLGENSCVPVPFWFEVVNIEHGLFVVMKLMETSCGML